MEKSSRIGISESSMRGEGKGWSLKEGGVLKNSGIGGGVRSDEVVAQGRWLGKEMPGRRG